MFHIGNWCFVLPALTDQPSHPFTVYGNGADHRDQVFSVSPCIGDVSKAVICEVQCNIISM